MRGVISICDNVQHQEEVKLLFPIFIEDIRRTKNQQWVAAYYVLLLQGAIYKLHLDGVDPYILKAASVIVAIFGIYVIWNYQRDLREYQNIKDNLSYSFSQKTQNIILPPDKSKEKDNEKLRIILSHVFMILLALTAIVNWIIIGNTVFCN